MSLLSVESIVSPTIFRRYGFPLMLLDNRLLRLDVEEIFFTTLFLLLFLLPSMLVDLSQLNGVLVNLRRLIAARVNCRRLVTS